MILSLSVGGRGLNRWAEGERTREERKQGACSCSVFKVCVIRLILTRGPGLMKLFLLFSLTLCSHLPECLSLCGSLLPCSWFPLFFLCLSALFMSVHFCFISDGSSRSPHPVSHLSLFSVCPQVDYRTEDGTANAGSDYEFAEGTLLFKPGETLKGKK